MKKPPAGEKQASAVVKWEMPLIRHEVKDSVIDQRATDGYVNATAMCRVAGKQFHDYSRTKPTKEFLRVLEAETGRPLSALIQQFRGHPSELQGTWVHPDVAIHLAQWLSPEFAVKVSQWVREWFGSGGPRREALPDHVRRYLVNHSKIPATHFSMLDQMTLRLLAPLESKGYILPPHLMPDIALGIMFSTWCYKHGFDPDTFPTYEHEFIDGHRPVVNARLYPNELMTAFNLELENWIRDGRALKYFKERDKKAISPIQKVITALPPPDEDDTSA